jgi:hypothetical protein
MATPRAAGAVANDAHNREHVGRVIAHRIAIATAVMRALCTRVRAPLVRDLRRLCP